MSDPLLTRAAEIIRREERNGPQSFAVTMGMDAFRICIGQPPKNHSSQDVQRWMRLIAAQLEARAGEGQT